MVDSHCVYESATSNERVLWTLCRILNKHGVCDYFQRPSTSWLHQQQSLKQNEKGLNRGSYMSAQVLSNLLNELGKRDKMRGLSSILSLFRNKFNKFNNTRAWMLDSIYHMTNTLKSHFWHKNVMILSSCTQRCYGSHNVSSKSVNH